MAPLRRKRKRPPLRRPGIILLISRRFRLPTISFRCRGRWSLTTARSHLPDSPPDFTAWDCSPLLSFATCAGLGRTARIYRGRLLDAKAAVPLGLSAYGKLCCIPEHDYTILVPEIRCFHGFYLPFHLVLCGPYCGPVGKEREYKKEEAL